jgi:photosystem II stability/assembly factor-like uncharacterized protein
MMFPLQNEAWAAGGSGILLRTTDGGKSWVRDRVADQIAANLYSRKVRLLLVLAFHSY